MSLIDAYQNEQIEPLIKNVKRNWWLYVCMLIAIAICLGSLAYTSVEISNNNRKIYSYYDGIIERYCPILYTMMLHNETMKINYSIK